jgi:hypothetical protein
MANHIQGYYGLGWLCLLGAKKVATLIHIIPCPSKQENKLGKQGHQLQALCLAQLIIGIPQTI